jgi:hypothetical protein
VVVVLAWSSVVEGIIWEACLVLVLVILASHLVQLPPNGAPHLWKAHEEYHLIADIIILIAKFKYLK